MFYPLHKKQHSGLHPLWSPLNNVAQVDHGGTCQRGNIQLPPSSYGDTYKTLKLTVARSTIGFGEDKRQNDTMKENSRCNLSTTIQSMRSTMGYALFLQRLGDESHDRRKAKHHNSSMSIVVDWNMHRDCMSLGRFHAG